MNPLHMFNKEELISYASILIDQAKSRLETDEPEAACWRLADALGAISECVPAGTMGVHEYTGLGYKISVKQEEQ